MVQLPNKPIFEFQNMETFQNTSESFTEDEEENVVVSNLPNLSSNCLRHGHGDIATNASTTSSEDASSIHKQIHSPPSHPSQRQLSFSVENILAPGRFGHTQFSAHHSFDDGRSKNR